VTSRAGRAARWALAHAGVVVGAVATSVRLLTVAVLYVQTRPALLGDEVQYLGLARTVAAGHHADSWFPGYGQSLYNSTRAFMAPLVFLVRLAGPDRIVGQLLAAGLGIGVAVGTLAMARLVAPLPAALAAALVVAVWPSQVLWSSLVLRESMVWAGLVVVAMAAMSSVEGPARAVGSVVLAAVGLLVLGATRAQVEVVAAWALLATAVLLVRTQPRRAMSLALVACVVPVVGGMGIAGYRLAVEGAGAAARIRVALGVGADTAIERPTVVGRVKPRALTTDDPHGGALAIARRRQEVTVEDAAGRHSAVRGADGSLYALDEGASANLRAVPRGLAAFLLRPFPWDPGDNWLSRLSAAENLGWVVLYGMAGLGLLVNRHRLATVAFPVLVVLGVVGSSALTEGNAGTAFRHRGEILWALCVVAAPGAAWLWDAAGRRRGHAEPVPFAVTGSS
jgi:hypothetical protein